MTTYFNIKRFSKFYLYDFKRIIPKLTKSLIALFLAYIFATLIVGVLSFLLGTGWQTIPNAGRWIIAFLSCVIAIFIAPAGYYGHITKKGVGISYMMIPASKFEKTLTMLINSVVIIPLFVVITVTLSDLVVTIIDPEITTPLIASIDNIQNFISGLSNEFSIYGQDNILTLLAVNGTIDLINRVIFVLLCAIYFKKNKIAMTIVSYVLVSILLSMLFSLITNIFANSIDAENLSAAIEKMTRNGDYAMAFLKKVTIYDGLKDLVVMCALIFGVHYRVSRIQH